MGCPRDRGPDELGVAELDGVGVHVLTGDVGTGVLHEAVYVAVVSNPDGVVESVGRRRGGRAFAQVSVDYRTERYRAVTSHYGRHWFTTFWTVEQECNRELVKYMRGDSTSRTGGDGPPGAIETYIHTYFEDIEPLYRENIFKLGV